MGAVPARQRSGGGVGGVGMRGGSSSSAGVVATAAVASSVVLVPVGCNFESTDRGGHIESVLR